MGRDVRPWAALKPVLRCCTDQDLGFVLAAYLEDRMLASIFVTQIGRDAVYVYGGYRDVVVC